MPPNRISILVALEGSDEGLERALSSAERSLGELAVSAKTAGEKASAGVAEVKAGMAAWRAPGAADIPSRTYLRQGRSIAMPSGSLTVPPMGMALTNSLSVSAKIW